MKLRKKQFLKMKTFALSFFLILWAFFLSSLFSPSFSISSYLKSFKMKDSLFLSSFSGKTLSKKTLRETEFGNIHLSKKKAKEEVSVIHFIDPAFKKQWGLHLMDSKKAWERHQAHGSKDIVVAVIDTGIDIHHPDLRENLWVNQGETGIDEKGRNKSTNGIDDDNNGFIDDVNGWNFAKNNNDVSDNHGHGTHIAGIIGADGGNGVGISGVAHKVSFMALNYFDPKEGSKNLENTIKSIQYAVKMKAHIINYSGGGLTASQDEKEAILEAQKKGILFIAAAGNERSNIDQKDYFPADYELNNILSVTAIDKTLSILPSSNYGSQSVDIAAPGNRIYSTLPKGRYGYMTGTSQATAFVTGVAVLIMSKFKDYTVEKIIRHITETGNLEQKTLRGKTRHQKRLNAYRALAITDSGVSLTGTILKNSIHFYNKFQNEPNSYENKAPSSDLLSLNRILKGKIR